LKQIIIFSEERDHVTSEVIKWINYFNYNSLRINIDDALFKTVTLSPKSVSLKTSFKIITINPGDIVWFRRISIINTFFFKKKENDRESAIRKFYVNERVSTFNSLIHWITINCNIIGNPFDSKPNKVQLLLNAKKVGLESPDWIVTGKKNELSNFINKHRMVAHKNFNHLAYIHNNKSFKNLTSLITKNSLKKFEDNFEPALFQKYIEKKYELRIFQWQKSFYSMAIFSQNDSKTKIDFRNYNKDFPNRNIPVNVPQSYLNLLLSYSNEIGLDHGSYDILVTKTGEFYFLEVNPIGQFEMVSGPCNYYIEKDIAFQLIKLKRLK